MLTSANLKNAENAKKFICELCDFKCSRQSNYNIHLLTLKHKKANKCYQNANALALKNAENAENAEYDICCPFCFKKLKHKSSLSRHKKTCNQKRLNVYIVENNMNNTMGINNTNNVNELNDINNTLSNIVITPELIVQLIKTQINNSNDIKQIIVEQNNTFQNTFQHTIQSLVTNGVNNNSQNIIQNNSNNNSNNKSFNLQFFLNETCKNAMNIMDFANSIQLKLTDLESIGELGYVDGISKIIIDNLNMLDVTERPVHCSDFKRDVIYVKTNNKWEKEKENNPNIKKLINSVTNKNISLIPEWKQKYPECYNSDSIQSTKINKMIMEVMETDHNKKDKIIKKIAKEVVIDKEKN